MTAATESNKRDLLRKAGIFSTLGPQELAVIEKYSEFRSYTDGASIFEPGSTGEELFVVARGQVLIRRHVEDGEDIDVARYIAGDSFGEMDLFYDAPRNAAALAENDALLLVFPGKEMRFESILSEHPILSAQILHKFMAIVAGRIRGTNKLISENTQWIQELRKQVLGDKLTGLHNAAFLTEEFPRILSSTQEPVVLMMVKPDDFKHINDTYGHEAGDKALKTIAATLRTVMRSQDTGLRYRGNELAIIMVESGRKDARNAANRVLNAMRKIDLGPTVGEPAGSLPLTVSISYALYPEDCQDGESLTERVHELLYEARDSGGDRVVST
jgi:diguanylate cyclase (GGDEF)-like protein